MHLIAPIALAIVSCGPVPDPLRTVGYPPVRDEALKPYVQEVEIHAALSGVDMPNKRLSYSLVHSPIEESMPSAVGVCYTSRGRDAIIKISIEYWDNASELEKRALMFHEVGHCLFDLGHDDKDMTSIMYPYVFSNEYLQFMLDRMIEGMMNKLRRSR